MANLMSTPPVGAVTLLFTDIEGSTRLVRTLGASWKDVVAVHHRLLIAAIAARGGYIEREAGDSFFALFYDPVDAVEAAAAIQRALAAHAWPESIGALRVRIGMHSGYVEHAEHGYRGLDIHLGARVESAGHGGQILLTEPLRRALGDAFEVENLGEHRLKDFPAPERLYLLVHDGRRAADFPPLRTAPVRPTNLPDVLAPIVGRGRELAELRALLVEGEERIVTVLGLGGTGKTRLATAVAADLLDLHEGGVWHVPLAGVRAPEALLSAIAAELAVVDQPGMSLDAALAERLSARPTLLLLDNFEQLVDAAPTLGALLDKATACRVLVTSQLPLRIARERVLRLGPMRRDEAVALLRERAPQASEAVAAAIVERLDGLPLALELAAARVALMGPDELLRRLDRSLAVLGRGSRDLPERHRSLRATLEWTLELLSDEERTLLARLAAFAGPAPLDAVEAVAEAPAGLEGIDVLEALSGLIEASLVRLTEDREHGVRYETPQAVRDFAAEKLAASGEEAMIRAAHADHVAQLAEACRFWHPGHADAARARVLALEEEQRVALGWTREHDSARHLRVASALAGRLTKGGRLRESRYELGVALERHPVAGVQAGWAAAVQAFNRCVLEEPQAGAGLLEQGLAALRAVGEHGEVLELALRIGSVVHIISGAPEEAVRATDEALAIARRRGEVNLLGAELGFHASTLMQAGRHDEAGVFLDELETLLPRATDSMLAALLDDTRGDWALARGDWPLAAGCYARSAIAMEKVEDHHQTNWDFQGLIIALAELGQYEAALECEGLLRALQADTGSHGAPTEAWAVRLDSLLARARAKLGPERAEAAAQRGRSLGRAEQLSRALELAGAAA